MFLANTVFNKTRLHTYAPGSLLQCLNWGYRLYSLKPNPFVWERVFLATVRPQVPPRDGLVPIVVVCKGR